MESFLLHLHFSAKMMESIFDLFFSTPIVITFENMEPQ